MQRRPLGSSGIDVPVVGMGTWKSFDVSGAKPEGERRAIVDAALASGTTLFDTSPMYGESERVLGTALAGRRENVLVADKVWTSSTREAQAQIARALEWYEGSVDVYQIHNLVSWREHLPRLEDLRARGAVRVIGATHYAHDAFSELMRVMQTGRVEMVQIPYNPADREVEKEVLPLARELSLGVLVMEPLGSGALVRRPPAKRDLERLAPFGIQTWAQALIKWILSDERVHCVLPATSKRARATENARAGDPPWFDVETRELVAHLATGRRP